MTQRTGDELLIVDNSDSEWKALDYLREWTEISKQFDISTGYFEIGALLALDGHWQKVDKIRILMGDEATKRTKVTLLEGLKRKLDDSVETEKEKNDFLKGVPAIIDGIKSGKIECRVYNKNKFHAKSYITHSRLAVVGSSALVGSSNFTKPGLTENIELNVQLRREVEELQAWYEKFWDQAEDISDEILKTIERHTREYSPFEVYAKALHEYFRGAEISVGEWELRDSDIYKKLDGYQQEGYQALVKIAKTHNGAFLCDGVGLGKTFIGMMLIERLIEHERKRVALVVPKAARTAVWERTIEQYLPEMYGGDGIFSGLTIINHTDLGREKMARRLDRIKEMADVLVIDEAHHFRNRNSRYNELFRIAEGKQVIMLTATPINNYLTDFQHMIELFTRRQLDYFKTSLGIHSIPGYFREKEKSLEQSLKGRIASNGNLKEESEDIQTNIVEAEAVLTTDHLFRSLVVQRSRAYVKESQIKAGAPRTLFPEKLPPAVAEYSVKRTYGRLLDVLDRAFKKNSPLFSLAVYHPEAYTKGEADTKLNNRQAQVVGLIRTNFLKRFESSAFAFEQSCIRLLGKLLAFIEMNGDEAELKRLYRWKSQKAEKDYFTTDTQQPLFDDQVDLGEASDDGGFDHIVTEDLLAQIERLDRDQFKVDEIIDQTFLDLDQIIDFLDEIKKFEASKDDKLQKLIKLLQTDKVLKANKVLIFTEFKDTAAYMLEELKNAGIDGVEKIDSGTKEDRGQLIQRFAPYYNASSSGELAVRKRDEIRVLISTDVLSEGLNLQDATRLINYDLHWNPVRLMQRIGRVDRRMNPEVESRLIADHPEQKELRGNVAYWNFLPPDELDKLLALYERVARKTLRISRTFGIEGRKLLRPDDEFEDLRDFLHAYEGEKTSIEELRLEYKDLVGDTDLEAKLDKLPLRVFSGKKHPDPGTQSVFFCYRLPVLLRGEDSDNDSETPEWSTEDGLTAWYLYDLATGKIEEEPSLIVNKIRSTPETPRHRGIADEALSEIRAKVDKHIKNGYLKKIQAPVGVKPVLKAWMEIS
jgi:superfamily II DNA or RNA helicase